MIRRSCTFPHPPRGLRPNLAPSGAVDIKRGRYEEAAAAESVWGNEISSQMIESALGAVNAVEVPVCDSGNAYVTFRLNFHHFDRFELDLRGHIHVRGAAFSCLRLKLADIVLI